MTWYVFDSRDNEPWYSFAIEEEAQAAADTMNAGENVGVVDDWDIVKVRELRKFSVRAA
jgi:hypothetical protein